MTPHIGKREMDENKFWLLIVSIFCGTVIVVVGLAIGYNQNQNQLLAESHDPIALQCAMNSADVKACLVATMRRGTHDDQSR